MSNSFEKKLLSCIETGLKKARELKYIVENMKLSAWIENSHCFVYLEPQSDPNTIVTGGDLTIKIDFDRNQIIEFIRGQ